MATIIESRFETSLWLSLSGEVKDQPRLDGMTPRQIVAELDKYVGGHMQPSARSLSHSQPNPTPKASCRPRSRCDSEEHNNDRLDWNRKNGNPRRLARLSNSPFSKVEASKFTEVGYVGRDVESMTLGPCRNRVDLVREEKIAEMAERPSKMPKTPARPAFAAHQADRGARERLVI